MTLRSGQYGRYGHPCTSCGFLDTVAYLPPDPEEEDGEYLIQRWRFLAGGDGNPDAAVSMWANNDFLKIDFMFVSSFFGCDLLVLFWELNEETEETYDLVAHRVATASGFDHGEVWRRSTPFKIVESEIPDEIEEILPIQRGPNGVLMVSARRPEPGVTGLAALIEYCMTINELDGTVINEATSLEDSTTPQVYAWPCIGEDDELYGGRFCSQEDWSTAGSFPLSGKYIFQPKKRGLFPDPDRPRSGDCYYLGDETDAHLIGKHPLIVEHYAVSSVQSGAWHTLTCFVDEASSHLESMTSSPWQEYAWSWPDDVLIANPIIYYFDGGGSYQVLDCSDYDFNGDDDIYESGFRFPRAGVFHEGKYYAVHPRPYPGFIVPPATPSLFYFDVSSPADFDPRDWTVVEELLENHGVVTNVRCDKLYIAGAYLDAGTQILYPAAAGSFGEGTHGVRYNLTTGEIVPIPLAWGLSGDWLCLEVVKDALPGGDIDCDLDDVCGAPEIGPTCECTLVAPQLLVPETAYEYECYVRAHFANDENIILGTCDGVPVPIREIHYLTYYRHCATAPPDPGDVAPAPGEGSTCDPGLSRECPTDICVNFEQDVWPICHNKILYAQIRACPGIGESPECLRGFLDYTNNKCLPLLFAPDDPDGDGAAFGLDPVNKHWCQRFLVVMVVDECGQVACLSQTVSFDFAEPGDNCCCWPQMKLRFTFVQELPFGGCYENGGTFEDLILTNLIEFDLETYLDWCSAEFNGGSPCCEHPCTESVVIQVRRVYTAIPDTHSECRDNPASGETVSNEEFEDWGACGSATPRLLWGASGTIFEVRARSGSCYSKALRIFM